MFQPLIPDNVEISYPKLFMKFFLGKLDSPTILEKALYDLSEQCMDKQLKKDKYDIWQIAKGCPEVCPFCGAKCSLREDHLMFERKHECDIHTLPGFGGCTFNGREDFPIFERCNRSKEFLSTLACS